MIICNKCEKPKVAADYYDSCATVCKECIKARTRKNRAARIDYYRAYDRSRGNRQPDGYQREYYEANREKVAVSKGRWVRTNSEKRSAQIAVGNAVRDGKLTKQPCERCGTTEKVHGHHEDYSKPLDVMWLCPKHHGDRHREINAERRQSA